MKTISTLCITLVLSLTMHFTAFAQADKANDVLKDYINETVQQVKVTDDADEKRAILNNSFENIIDVIERVEAMNRIPVEDRESLALLKDNISDKLSELNGEDGFNEVQDEDLDEFSDYAQQDMEQARRYITIGLGTAVIIALLLLLL